MVRAILQRGRFPVFTIIVLVVVVVWSSIFSENKWDPWMLGGIPIVFSLVASLIYWIVFYRTGKKTESPTRLFVDALDCTTMGVLAWFIYDSFVPDDTMFKIISFIYLALCWILAVLEPTPNSSECKVFVSSLYLTPFLVFAAIVYEEKRENR